MENLIGIVSGEDYEPTVELMRFMTPFGVGHYSSADDSLSSKRKPVYIDQWADSVSWEQNITDLYPLLEGGAYVGVFIDTWTPEGYIASVTIDDCYFQVHGDIAFIVGQCNLLQDDTSVYQMVDTISK